MALRTRSRGLTRSPHRPLLSYPLDEILKVFENNHIDPPWSHLLVLGLDVVIIGTIAWCVFQILEARRMAQQAKRTENASLPLYEGARFVSGSVELAEGSNMAIRVTITQEGSEFGNKDNPRHRWSEIDREIDAQPFYLQHASGARIRVEPPSDVMLVDKLDQMEWLDAKQRRKRAELTGGESAFIEGVLERGQDPEEHSASAGYRSAAASGWIMKPSRRRGMSVSTENLSRRHELRVRAFVKTTVILAALAIVAGCCTLPYRARLWRGSNVVAHYQGKQVFQTRQSKGGVKTHYVVNVKISGALGDTHQQFDVDERDYRRLPQEHGQIWLRHVPAHPWTTVLGKGSSVSRVQPLLAAIIVALGIFQAVRTHRYRRWYEGHLLETGNGMLPPPTNARFAERPIPDNPPLPTLSRAREVIDPIEPDFKAEGKSATGSRE